MTTNVKLMMNDGSYQDVEAIIIPKDAKTSADTLDNTLQTIFEEAWVLVMHNYNKIHGEENHEAVDMELVKHLHTFINT